MPFYAYKCIHCYAEEERLGGLDDDTALCLQCGNIMLRLDEDVFQPYFEESQKEQVAQPPQVASANS